MLPSTGAGAPSTGGGLSQDNVDFGGSQGASTYNNDSLGLDTPGGPGYTTSAGGTSPATPGSTSTTGSDQSLGAELLAKQAPGASGGANPNTFGGLAAGEGDDGDDGDDGG